jgi:hypothetical protein
MSDCRAGHQGIDSMFKSAIEKFTAFPLKLRQSLTSANELINFIFYLANGYSLILKDSF